MSVVPMEFDSQSYTPGVPHIITADCSNPHEIDDGVFVRQLDSDKEAYRVGVCIADGRKLYRQTPVLTQALGLTKSTYFQLADNEHGYEAMIPDHYLFGKDLRQGNLRTALIVSFVAERGEPLSDVKIDFGNVQVIKNLSYKELSQKSRALFALGKYASAANIIADTLGYIPGGDKTTPIAQDSQVDLRVQHWKNGSRIVEAYMIAANALVGNIFAEEGRPAIYRVHDVSDTTHNELIEPHVAMYSRKPGIHKGLNLRNFSRVTSPLRRLEDLVMHHHLGLRVEGKMPTKRDKEIMSLAIRALNQRTIADRAHRTTTSARANAQRLSLILDSSSEEAIA